MNGNVHDLSQLVLETLKDHPPVALDASWDRSGVRDEEFARMARAFVHSLERRPGAPKPD